MRTWVAGGGLHIGPEHVALGVFRREVRGGLPIRQRGVDVDGVEVVARHLRHSAAAEMWKSDLLVITTPTPQTLNLYACSCNVRGVRSHRGVLPAVLAGIIITIQHATASQGEGPTWLMVFPLPIWVLPLLPITLPLLSRWVLPLLSRCAPGGPSTAAVPAAPAAAPKICATNTQRAQPLHLVWCRCNHQ